MTAVRAHQPITDGGEGQRYWDLVGEKFLIEAGWDTARQVLVIPWDHPWLGWRRCTVDNCDAPAFGQSSYCSSCLAAWKSSDLPEAGFMATHQRRRALRVEACAVTGCPRPWLSATAQLCRSHDGTRRRLDLSVPQFLRHEMAQPLPDLGKCRVAACPRRADLQQRRVCLAHNTMLLRELARNSQLDVARWLAVESAITEYGDVSFGGLRPTVIAQVLYGLQARCTSSVSTKYSAVRVLCDALRHANVDTVEAISPPESRAALHLWKSTLTALRRAFTTPAAEQHNDIWDMAVLGHKGRLLFIDTDDRPGGRARALGWIRGQPAVAAESGQALGDRGSPETPWLWRHRCPARLRQLDGQVVGELATAARRSRDGCPLRWGVRTSCTSLTGWPI